LFRAAASEAARHFQRDPAGDQKLEGGAVRQEASDDGGREHDVLEVVEHQQQTPTAQERHEAIDR
jgi:hypothetical protein